MTLVMVAIDGCAGAAGAMRGGGGGQGLTGVTISEGGMLICVISCSNLTFCCTWSYSMRESCRLIPDEPVEDRRRKGRDPGTEEV